jgi:hypothetical protein
LKNHSSGDAGPSLHYLWKRHGCGFGKKNEQMRRAWYPQQPVESLFKQIQECADYSEAGVVIIGHPQHINVGYAKKLQPGTS